MSETETLRGGPIARPTRQRRLLPRLILGLCAGVGALATMGVAIDWLQGLETWFWDESSCTITSATAIPRPDVGDHQFQVSYRYRHRGRQFVGDGYRRGYQGSEEASHARVLASRYPAGSIAPCWVDPDDPGRSYLERANLWQGLWLLAPLVFVAAGVGGLQALRAGERLEPASGRAAPIESIGQRARSMGVGGGALILLFGIFFLFGVGFLLPFFVWPALQVVEARSWSEVSCEILSSEVRSHPGEDTTTYSVDALFRYEIGGQEVLSDRYGFMGGSSSGYEAKAKIVEAIPPGTRTVCYVDPDDPFEAVLERGFTPDFLFGLVPLVFVLIGAAGLAWAIAVARAARKDAARPSWAAPASPRRFHGDAVAAEGFAELGRQGPIVLEPIWSPVGKVGCSALVALFWNGIVSLFVWQLVQDWRAGHPEWFVAIVLAPFVLIGLLLIAGVPFSTLALLNPRPRLRLSRNAIPAGSSAQLEWTFRGSARRIRRLKIWLEAIQTTVERDRTSLRTRTEPFASIEILDRTLGEPREFGAVSFTLPTDTEPTSTEGDRQIRWKLRLQGEIAYWPDVDEEYEIEVLAAG